MGSIYETQALHNEGYTAFELGKPISECPYEHKKGSLNARGYWEGGWHKARDHSIYCDTHPIYLGE